MSAAGWRSSCLLDAAAARGTLGEMLDLLASRGPKERNRQLHDSYHGLGTETESTASRYRAMPARDWPAGRVFYQGLLSDRRALREAAREKQTRVERSTNPFALSERSEINDNKEVFIFTKM